MDTNYIWTSERIKGVIDELLVGITLEENFLQVINLNPNKDPYQMMGVHINNEISGKDFPKKWKFYSNLSTEENKTSLRIILDKPFTEVNFDEIYHIYNTSINLQIVDNTEVYLILGIPKDIIIQ